MKTTKSSDTRKLIPALMLSVLPFICSCQNRGLYISNNESEPHEQAAYDCDGQETTKDLVKDEEECDKTMLAAIRYLENDDDCKNNPDCFVALKLGMPTPSPCPSASAHCIPFLMNSRICFYSEADKRPVEIFVNGNRIGTARDVSYDRKKKLRTVSFDVKKNLKNSAANGQNDLNIIIPVTYPVRSAEGRPTGDITQTQLKIAAKF